MIDPAKCEFEESHEFDGIITHYFTYPIDFEVYEDFYSKEDYGNVVSMCISLTCGMRGEYRMAISPTVEYEDTLTDVDWRDLYDGRHYNDNIVFALLEKVKGEHYHKRYIGRNNMHERNLEITLQLHEGGQEFGVYVYDPESGDQIYKLFPFVGDDPHSEFDDWIGSEIYSWLSIMADEKDEQE
jgi:hypothetical protein